MLNFPLLMGAPAGGVAQSSPQGSMAQIGMIVAVFAIFWFLIIRPQRKKQRETKDMLATIKKGDKVVSIGGIRGTVKNVHENTVVLVVDSKGNTLEFLKTAIGSVEKGESPPIGRRSTDAPSANGSVESGESTPVPASKKSKKTKTEESSSVKSSSQDKAEVKAEE